MQKSEVISIADQIDAILPQTQCRKCGFQGCRPYAEAIASASAGINQCPPGGKQGIKMLAELLGVAPKPLNEAFGVEKPTSVAFIIEDQCIGCAKCLQACPVDAILGASKQMHTVISEQCTGCELCIAPCPVDCIIMRPITIETGIIKGSRLKKSTADLARKRYQAKQARLEKQAKEKAERMLLKKQALAKMKAKIRPKPEDFRG